MQWMKVVAVVLLLLALGFKPLANYVKVSRRTPIDTAVGQLELLSASGLSSAYSGKRTLVVGGTRGIGRGVAGAIAAAGGDVTVVGRSSASGASAVAFLKQSAKSPKTQQIKFLAGDLGSVRSTKALVRALEAEAKTAGRFDYLVVTAAVFPDWADLLNEDGIEKGHAIGVVGRYALYRHMNLFVQEGARVLNVAASGEKEARFDRDIMTAKRNVTGLIETVLNWAGAHEMSQIGLQESNNFHKTTRVSTNPGLLGTELHDGQGWVMDIIEPIMVALIGISEEECGHRQASILASPRLHKEGLTYVDEDLIGRTRSTALQEVANKHLSWLMAWLNERTEL